MQRSSSDASVLSSVATMPRTSEVLWDGASSLPFVLKRKRNGAILVTKIKADRRGDTALDLRLGSELKLVGGFPVQQLTLGEVKKVMLHAPKPVSLVFLNHDDVVLDNMSFLSEYRGSFENEFEYDSSDNIAAMYPTLRESSEWQDPQQLFSSTSKSECFNSAYEAYNPFDSSRSLGSSVFDTPTPASTSRSASASASALTSTSRSSSSASRRRRRSPDANSQPRKVSKLKQAFDRMNELLNRPVRRSGLNVTSGKSIVV